MRDLLHEEWRPYGGSAPTLGAVKAKLVAAKAPNPLLERLESVFQEAGKEPLNQQGTWLTRVKNLYYKAHNENIDDKIGQILGNAIVPSLEARFTRLFDWTAGDYGDRSSCYFSFNVATRMWFQEVGIHAMLLRRNGNGIGRVWLWPRENYILAWGGQGARAAVHLSSFLEVNKLKAEERSYAFSPSGSSLYDSYNSCVVFAGDKRPKEADPQSLKDHGFPYPSCAKCGKKEIASFALDGDKYVCREGYYSVGCKK